jgi:hypothetical protein
VSAALKGVRTLKEIYTGRGLEFFCYIVLLGSFPTPLSSQQAASATQKEERGKITKRFLKNFPRVLGKSYMMNGLLIYG